MTLTNIGQLCSTVYIGGSRPPLRSYRKNRERVWGGVLAIKIEQCPKFHPIGGGLANKSNANGKTRVGQKQSVPGE